MSNGWLSTALIYPVEHVPLKYLNENVDAVRPAAGVLHTTEGSFESALAEFKIKFAPHFLVGNHRIIQFAPLGNMSHALEHRKGTVETNRWVRAQIEIAGASKSQPWLPDWGTLDPLAALVAVLKDVAHIPLKRHWADFLPKDVVWATEKNPRRTSGVWGCLAGWFGHIEVPGNSHWDPGALKYDALFARARALKEDFSEWLPP